MPYALKFLAPEPLAAAIIGRGGAAIAAMRSSGQARLALTDKGEVYPNTDCRVLTIQANSEEQLNEVTRQILAKLEAVATGSNVVEACGDEGNLKIKTLIPRAAVGGVIGKKGEKIKALRETSGAKISISEPAVAGAGADQIAAVLGDPQAR